MLMNYADIYNQYWNQRKGEMSYASPDKIAQKIIKRCGGGKVLDLGCGYGHLLRSLLSMGVDAYGLDVASVAIDDNATWCKADRIKRGSILSAPYDSDWFDTVVCTDVLEHLSPEDVPQALSELHRMTRKYVFLTIALKADRDDKWHLTIENRYWWQEQILKAGFRHGTDQFDETMITQLNRGDNSSTFTAVFEKIPTKYPDVDNILCDANMLHDDMLVRSGPRAESYITRYKWATNFIRPNDTVLDLACGLGYGSYIINNNSCVEKVYGVDIDKDAIDYAKSYYTSDKIEFMLCDGERDLPFEDNSIDTVVCFETLEHLSDPEKFIAAIFNKLRPGGRFICSVPNSWVDETGNDPNPHHHCVYDKDKLLAELGSHFELEKLAIQTAGGGLKLSDSERVFKYIDPQDDDSAGEWLLSVAAKSPMPADDVSYKEKTYSRWAPYDLKTMNWDAEYNNPWLVYSMVTMGLRTTDQLLLQKYADQTLGSASIDSPDYGAALCVAGYRMLGKVSGKSLEKWLGLFAEYSDKNADSELYNVTRWLVSCNYLAGRLLLETGRSQAALESFDKCCALPWQSYSALLATKVVDACYYSGMICLNRGEHQDAEMHWKNGVEFARQAIQSDWTSELGDMANPFPPAIPELRDVLDITVKCSRALNALNRNNDPHYFWKDLFSIPDNLSLLKELTENHKELSAFLDTQTKDYYDLVTHTNIQNKQIQELSDYTESQNKQIAELSDHTQLQQEQIAKLTDLARTQDKEIVELASNIKLRSKEYDNLATHAEIQNKQISELTNFTESQKSHIAQLTSDIDKLTNDYNELTIHAEIQDKQIQELSGFTASQKEQITKLIADIDNWTKEHNNLVIHAENQNKEINDLSEFNESQSRQIAELTSDIEYQINQCNSLSNHISQQLEQIESLNIAQQHLNEEHQSLTSERNSLAVANDQLQASLDSARQHSEAVQHELDGVKQQKLEILSLANSASYKLQELKKRKYIKIAKLFNYINWNLMKGSFSHRMHSLGTLCKRTASSKTSLDNTHFMDVLDDYFQSIKYQCQSSVKPMPLLPLATRKTSLPSEPVITTNDAPVVSIVLPVYNQADLLAESIDSVIKQSYENWELFIINDGSKDDIEAVFEQYADNPKILLLTQDNQQLPKALSNAFQFATGKFVTWTSADNLMHPEQIERLVEYLLTNPDADMVYSDYYAIDDNGEMLTDPEFRPHNRTEPDSPAIHVPRDPSPINAVADNFIGASFMYRRSAMNIIGEYDPQLGVEDYDYWMRINALLKIEHLGTDELLYYYRVHDNSLNARAKELKIFDAVSHLMSYEMQRNEYYSTPFDIVCSGDLLGLNPKRFLVKSLTPLSNNSHANDITSEKKLLLVSASDIPLACLEADKYDCICVWFNEDDSNLVYKYQYQIAEKIDACFCEDNTKAFERLNIIHPKVIDCQADVFMDKAIAFANNQLFYDKTHTAKQRRRAVPDVYRQHSKKRVMLQIDEYGYGGMEQVLLDVAETLIDTDSEVFICVCKPSEIAPKLADDRINLLFVDPVDREASYTALLRDNQIDIVNAHYSTFGADICHQMAIPFVQTIHNMYVWFDDEQTADYRRADEFTDAYICVSNNVAWYTNEILQLPEEKTLVINNGIDTDLFRFDPGARDKARSKFGFGKDDYVLLNLASVYAVKGQKHLAEAFAKASKKCPNLKMIIAGHIAEPPYYEQMVKTIDKAGLADKVIVGKRFEDTVELCHGADALVMPSFWEGCSLAIAECVAMGLPVLSTRVGDVENQTNMENCVIFDLPLDLLTDLKTVHLPDLLYKTQTELVSNLAKGIATLYNNHTRQVSDISRQKVNRTQAYIKYDKLFDLILSGARPESARNWLRQQQWQSELLSIEGKK